VAKTQQISATGVQFREAIASYTLEGYRAEALLGYNVTWDSVIALGRDVEFIVRYDESDLPAYPARIPYSWGRGVSATQSRGPTNNLYTAPDCVALLLDAANGPRSYVNTIYTNAPAVAADAGLEVFPVHPSSQSFHPQLGWQYFNSWQQCHEALWFNTWTALGRLDLQHLSA
jgi:hypothetical protein